MKITELAASMGLHVNPNNISDKDLLAIWEKVINNMRIDMDCLGTAFQSDAYNLEEYNQKMTEKRNYAVKTFYELIGEPITST